MLVSRGLAESREKARLMVMEGTVLLEGRQVVKPSTLVSPNAAIEVSERPRFVSRGGLKLDYALDQFKIDVGSRIALDVGASTGGFTDCLLQRGAARVYAVDVGYGQIEFRLRQDPRVVVMERVNAHHPFPLPELVDLATIDVSFISLEKVVPNVARLVKDGGFIISLVKPQFEAGRRQVGKGGIVRDPQVHAEVLGRFITWAVDNGFRLRGLTASPVAGAEGNREFLVLLQKS